MTDRKADSQKNAPKEKGNPTPKTDAVKAMELNQTDPTDTQGYSNDALLYLAITGTTPPQREAALAILFEQLGRPAPIDTGYPVGSVTEKRNPRIDGETGQVSLADPDPSVEAEAREQLKK